MSRRESAARALEVVGVERHPTIHFAKAVSAEQRVYILHSEACVASGIDLRKCLFSIALDDGIDMDVWEAHEDVAVPVTIDEHLDDLIPDHAAIETLRGSAS